MGAAQSQAEVSPAPPFSASPLPVPSAPPTLPSARVPSAPPTLPTPPTQHSTRVRSATPTLPSPPTLPSARATRENTIVTKEQQSIQIFKEEQNGAQIRKKLPHKFQSIIKEADNHLYNGSLDDYMHSGIFLNKKTKMFWVDEETGHNCFSLFARDLSITWSEDPRYWQWICLKETNDVEVEVASLACVCWLEIHGKLETSYLSPGVVYEVVFIVMMSDKAFGWLTPVNLRIKLQDGRVQERKECLHHKPKGKWIEIKVGDILIQPSQAGEIEVSMFEYEDGQWKGGILIKSVVIRPKKYT